MFFKEIKPRFFRLLIYYTKLCQTLARWPVSGRQQQAEYIQRMLTGIEQFREENEEFYTYFRSGLNYKDDQYFLRGRRENNLHFDYLGMYADTSFCTSHDRILAELMANKKLAEYLVHELQKINGLPASPIQTNEKTRLHWTGKKVTLVVMGYILKSSGLINGGQASLREIFDCLQQTFNINLGDYSRSWMQFCDGKGSKYRLIDLLKNALERILNDGR